jgi:hypothetical protein
VVFGLSSECGLTKVQAVQPQHLRVKSPNEKSALQQHRCTWGEYHDMVLG